ncbi:hypothetical protein NFJ02_30g77290 [Pycnococcus provasolii]
MTAPAAICSPAHALRTGMRNKNVNKNAVVPTSDEELNSNDDDVRIASSTSASVSPPSHYYAHQQHVRDAEEGETHGVAAASSSAAADQNAVAVDPSTSTSLSHEKKRATSEAGVTARFLEEFVTKVLPQFGVTPELLRTPTTREQWLERLSPNDKDVHVIEVDATQLITTENGESLVNLGDGLQARKSDVEHVRKLVRLPRCRNKDWELVEAEVDLTELPDKIHADTPLRVRVKGDPDAKWMDFLKARDVALVQTSDIVDFVVKPVTQWKNGRLIDTNDRMTYADHVSTVHTKGHEWVERAYYSGPATHFISHAWMDSYRDFTDAVTDGSSSMDDTSAYYRTKLKRLIVTSILFGSASFKLPETLSGIFKSSPSSAVKDKNKDARITGVINFFIIRQMLIFGFAPLIQIGYIIMQFMPSAKLRSVINMLRDYGQCADIKTRLWIDIYCKNQWVVNSSGTQEELKQNVSCAQRGLYLVCHSWLEPKAMQRVWCQFELSVARVMNKRIVGIACELREAAELRKTLLCVWSDWHFWSNLLIPFSSRSAVKKRNNNLPDELASLETTVDKIDFEKADATVKTDIALIRGEIERTGETAIEKHNKTIAKSYLHMLDQKTSSAVISQVVQWAFFFAYACYTTGFFGLMIFSSGSNYLLYRASYTLMYTSAGGFVVIGVWLLYGACRICAGAS